MTEETPVLLDDPTLHVPPAATREEAAAIAAAIGAHLRDQEVAAATAAAASASGAAESWDGTRFQYAGRMEAVTGTARRVPRNAPTDGWTTAGRLEGLE
jgi:hypothetical protein